MSTPSGHRLALSRGFLLDEYRVLDMLGSGGFGITYLVEQLPMGRLAAIKEYLPSDLAVRDGSAVHPKSGADVADFEWGMARFVDEAKTLARFKHANLVRVDDYFEGNNTAYIVMEYEDGKPLSDLLQQHGTLTETLLMRLLLPLLDGLRQVHAANFLHRDIKPSNIYVRRRDESPVLLDFGSARQAIGRRSRSMTAVVTPGYSPPEQYDSSAPQGPWSDIYALAALCHRAITGDAPVNSMRRLSFSNRKVDPVANLSDGPFLGYSTALLKAVDWGLRIDERSRPQDVDEWLRALGRQSHAEAATRTVHNQAVGPAHASASPQRLSIGRGLGVDVALAENSISRRHAKLTITHISSGSPRPALEYMLKDCDSRNGTFVFRRGRWRRIREEIVQPHERLRLGDYETSAEALMGMGMESVDDVGDDDIVASGDLDDEVEPASVPVRRDRRSGEVIHGSGQRRQSRR